ncbi:hypothetical protein MMC34_007038 [Xylographa carneopallida]|nr:hypothetical protein [Xylographa carneopallida]
MPIKWTSENDQLLLLKVLETHAISIDTKAVVAVWPTTNGEIPTPRAITERVLKIRSLAKAAGGKTASEKNSPTKSPGITKVKPTTAPNKPQTPRTKKENGTEKYGSGGAKRKRDASTVKHEEVSDDEDTEVHSNWLLRDDESPTKMIRAMHVEIKKMEEAADEGSSPEEA